MTNRRWVISAVLEWFIPHLQDPPPWTNIVMPFPKHPHHTPEWNQSGLAWQRILRNIRLLPQTHANRIIYLSLRIFHTNASFCTTENKVQKFIFQTKASYIVNMSVLICLCIWFAYGCTADQILSWKVPQLETKKWHCMYNYLWGISSDSQYPHKISSYFHT